jgi:tetratricopeptide (TPR) repeat protein
VSPTATVPATRAPESIRRVTGFTRSRSTAVMLLMLLTLLATACRKRVANAPTPPPAPPTPNFLALGDAAYSARNYAVATEAYQSFLRANPDAPERDRAMFRMAMGYMAKESPLYDPNRGLESLGQLAGSLPSSPYVTEANLYLGLHDELIAQQETLAERSRKIEELRGELARINLEESQRAEDLQKMKTEIARREERIKEVSAELERLKAIDMQRRPSAPRR